jgi:catechol 2,3-dioxygenase-like lactoylglutathione lyase family enzyme
MRKSLGRKANRRENEMSSTDVAADAAANASTRQGMAMKLEVVILPVADVDRAKAFYQGLGWRLDADISNGDTFRVVQLTPPASEASIHFGKGLSTMEPGSIETLVLAVEDIEAARAELLAKGAEVSEVFHGPGAGFLHPAPPTRDLGRDPGGESYNSFATFSDPDGNGWVLQEIKQRLPGRTWE